MEFAVPLIQKLVTSAQDLKRRRQRADLNFPNSRIRVNYYGVEMTFRQCGDQEGMVDVVGNHDRKTANEIKRRLTILLERQKTLKNLQYFTVMFESNVLVSVLFGFRDLAVDYIQLLNDIVLAMDLEEEALLDQPCFITDCAQQGNRIFLMMRPLTPKKQKILQSELPGVIDEICGQQALAYEFRDIQERADDGAMSKGYLMTVILDPRYSDQFDMNNLVDKLNSLIEPSARFKLRTEDKAQQNQKYIQDMETGQIKNVILSAGVHRDTVMLTCALKYPQSIVAALCMNSEFLTYGEGLLESIRVRTMEKEERSDFTQYYLELTLLEKNWNQNFVATLGFLFSGWAVLQMEMELREPTVRRTRNLRYRQLAGASFFDSVFHPERDAVEQIEVFQDDPGSENRPVWGVNFSRN